MPGPMHAGFFEAFFSGERANLLLRKFSIMIQFFPFPWTKILGGGGGSFSDGQAASGRRAPFLPESQHVSSRIIRSGSSLVPMRDLTYFVFFYVIIFASNGS